MELVQDGAGSARNSVLTNVHLCSYATAISVWHSLVEGINNCHADIHLVVPLFLSLVVVDFLLLLVDFFSGDINFELRSGIH